MTLGRGVCFTAILVCSSKIFWQSNALPQDSQALSEFNKTTTAIPVYNGLKTVAIPHTQSMTTATPASLITSKNYSSKTTASMESSIIPVTTKMVSTTDPTMSYDQEEKRQFFVTTTAISLIDRSVASDHHFDSLSFMGGTLLGISVIAVGTLAWKMYKARIERSYWTL